MRQITAGMAKIGALALGGLRVFTGSGAPTNGSSGTGAGVAGPGSEYTDKATNGATWVNVGTQAAPVWSPVTPVLFALSSANILAMNATPVTVIAAPPSGYAAIVSQILVAFTAATQYASGGVVTFQYSGGAAVHASSIPAATINSASSSNTLLAQNTAANGIAVLAATAITITNATGAFTTGTGTARVFLTYVVIKV